MNVQSLYLIESWQLCIGLFISIVITGYFGYKAGIHSRKKHEADNFGFKETKTGIITVLSLLMGFSFSMAGARYQSYKNVVMDEVNNIGTARLNSDLYPEPYRSEFRKYFTDYIDARIYFYDAGTNLEKINDSKKKSEEAGRNLWELSSRVFREYKMPDASRIMATGLTKMFESAKTRETTLLSKVPILITGMLFVVTIIAVFISGYGSGNFGIKEKIFVISFALVISLVMLVILDLDRPDRGLIKPNAEQKAMIELRNNVINDK